MQRQQSGAAAVAVATTRRKTVVAFDPGVKNLAVWKGYADLPASAPANASAPDEAVRTLVWRKIDITRYGSKAQILSEEVYSQSTVDAPGGSAGNPHATMAPRDALDSLVDQKRKGVYALVCNALSANEWIWRDVDVAVIETQDPTNTPARVIACAVYGFLRGVFRGTSRSVVFSGSASKAIVKKRMAETLGVAYDYADCVGTAVSQKAYHNTKRSSYDICRAWMLAYGGERDRAVVQRYHARTGALKGDDVAEAFLLGAAELCNKHGYQRKTGAAGTRTRTKKRSSTATVESGGLGVPRRRQRGRKSDPATAAAAASKTQVILIDDDSTETDSDSSTTTTTTTDSDASTPGSSFAPALVNENHPQRPRTPAHSPPPQPQQSQTRRRKRSDRSSSGGSSSSSSSSSIPAKKRKNTSSRMVLRPKKRHLTPNPDANPALDATLDAFFAPVKHDS